MDAITSQLIGPASGLAVSLFFCFQFLKKYEDMTTKLIAAFQSEIEACNDRYSFVLGELMKLKDGVG